MGLQGGGNTAGPGRAVGSELGAVSTGGAYGMRGVAVKCIDIAQKAECEGSVPGRD